MIINHNDEWRTANEMGYIDTLVTGKCLINPCTTPEERLRNYIISAKRRSDWDTFGGVSFVEVVMYAGELLGGLEGK